MNGSMSRIRSLIASQRRFIADASHQLRTPLTVLKTQSELALREINRSEAPPDRDALRAMVSGIAATTDAAVHLANRLLMLARIEHSGDVTPVPVGLRELAQNVALQLAVAAVNKQIDLALEAEHEAIVRGQPLLLQEMVSNLVDNALRYTPPGGSVTVRVLPGNGQLLLEVEDSGAGIPESERERVFSPFYRAAASMQVNPGGAGLGLAIVRDIAVLHGGTVTLSDGAGGRGLKVTVAFPG
jgi:two-component system sensor histidine kinase TctE